MNKQIFISHSTKDDEFVKNLREALEIQKLVTWVDSRELAPGDELNPKVKKGIEEARAFIVVISQNAFNSEWVLKETKYALKVKKKQGEDYKVIPIMLEGIKPAALKLYFKEEPVGLKVQVGAGGISEAMPQLLAALGERLPDDAQPMLRPDTEPVEELVLELSNPRITKRGKVRRAQAEAKLTYFPSRQGTREVTNEGRFLFTSPLGPIESDDLSWYLERYYLWPTGVFKQRAEKIEKQLPIWGKDIYDAVLHDDTVKEVLIAWRSVKSKAARRFTVYVDSQLVKGTKQKKKLEANEAATLLLTLPWELLNDGHGYLFHGAKPILVRRRLPNSRSLDEVVAQPPIRILMVSPRPEDDKAGYIDHRVSALPLVAALETLGELAELTMLSPPTFPALNEELKRAIDEGTPYHVVHFDGHGVFRKDLGLGGLCFEEPQDEKKLEKRRSQIIDAQELAENIREYRIPVFFLEACQSAKAEEDPKASVAARLLDEGVASVVAMSHSVLVETARRFVQSFYQKLAEGRRVGEAMLAGQRTLKSESFRLKIFGAGRLDLQDWFVPVLYQEKEDLQLLTRVPSREIKEIGTQALENRFGALPATPDHGFVGRSRELLKLERLLGQKPYAVLCGAGGEGKTTLAAELARWLIRSNRFERAAFVCVENVYDVRTVVDQIGRQLVTNYSVAKYSDTDLLTKALQPIERALRNEGTLIVLDNMESILPAEKGDDETVVARFEPEALETFLDLCKKLLKAEDTHLLFTSRKALPKPFATKLQRVTLSRLDKKDAIELVKQTMTAVGLTPKEDEKGGTQPEIEALVEAVNCHARSLVLLAPYISEFGVRHTTENLGHMMAELDKKYPDERERSLFASVELSLGRLSGEMREKIKPLGVFEGGGHIADIANVLELTEEERDSLVRELVETGLAEMMPYNFLRFHPALCSYLSGKMNEATLTQTKAKWAESMQQLSNYLYNEQFEDAQLSATLTMLELPNLMQLLEYTNAQGEPEATLGLVTDLEQLIAPLGRPHLLAQVVAVREAEVRKLGDWSNARFVSSKMQIERLLDGGNFPQALKEAQALLDKCMQAGEVAYSEAAYNTALAYILLGRVLRSGGASEAALEPIDEGYRRLQLLAEQGDTYAAGTASVCFAYKGDCLCDLGRLGEAAEAYEENIKRSEKLKNERQVAVGKGQLGTVRMYQGRYEEALKAHVEAREIFEKLGEPEMVTVAWHQIGMVHERANECEAAEQAYRRALSIEVQQNVPGSEAGTLNQLGNLYHKMDRLEEAIIFYRQVVDKFVEIKDMAKEGISRSNLANTLIKLRRYDEARGEIQRAIECDKLYGHAARPWKTWIILHNLEKDEGNQEAAGEARKKAVQLYLAYRRDGGENHEPSGQLCAQFLKAMQEKKQEEMEALLSKIGSDPRIHPFAKAFAHKLQAILGGSRDTKLAADPELYYRDAAEILFLLEKLDD